MADGIPRGLARHLPEPVTVFSGGRGMRHHVYLPPPCPKDLRLEARDKTKGVKMVLVVSSGCWDLILKGL